MAAEEKRKAQREQAFIPPVEEKPKKETKKKGEIFCDIHVQLYPALLSFIISYFLMVVHTTSLQLPVS